MSEKYVLSKLYRWMVISEDGLLKTPKDKWGEKLFSFPYVSKDHAIADYQRFIDNGFDCPSNMILVREFSKDYVVS
jgi:hypothetical protein